VGIKSENELHILLHRYSSVILAFEKMSNNNCEISSSMFILTLPGISITRECEVEMLPKFNGVKADLITVEQVNGIVSEATNGNITTILTSIKNISSIILNILYFKGEWENEFKFKGDLPFSFSNGESKDVPMMTLTSQKMLFGQNDLFDYVELKYKNNLSAGVILPRLGVSIKELISDFEGLFINLMEKQNYSMEHVVLTMPKFKVESSFDLKETLQRFGINDAFNGNADFSGIYENAGFHIDKIIHKSFISVDEKGTVAAAVTAVIMTRIKQMVPKPIIFNVDRPFVFVVFDNESKTNLFTTIVEDF